MVDAAPWRGRPDVATGRARLPASWIVYSRARSGSSANDQKTPATRSASSVLRDVAGCAHRGEAVPPSARPRMRSEREGGEGAHDGGPAAERVRRCRSVRSPGPSSAWASRARPLSLRIRPSARRRGCAASRRMSRVQASATRNSASSAKTRAATTSAFPMPRKVSPTAATCSACARGPPAPRPRRRAARRRSRARPARPCSARRTRGCPCACDKRRVDQAAERLERVDGPRPAGDSATASTASSGAGPANAASRASSVCSPGSSRA